MCSVCRGNARFIPFLRKGIANECAPDFIGPIIYVVQLTKPSCLELGLDFEIIMFVDLEGSEQSKRYFNKNLKIVTFR